jgi:hypothetical protein
MSDGGGIKGAIGQIAQDTGEALTDTVKDAVGEAIEEGTQSVISGPKVQPQDPQAAALKQQEQVKRDEENQKKKQWAEGVVARYQKIEEEQAQVRMQKNQEEQKKEQETEQEKQEEMIDLQQKNQKSEDMTAIQQAARKTETKGGVGG